MDYFASKELVDYAKTILPDPDVIMDLYDQTFAWASDKTAKTLGYSHQELAEKRVLDLRIKDKSDAEDLLEHTKEKDYVDVFAMRTKDGNRIDVKARVVMIDFQNHPYQVVKVLEITPGEK